MVPETAKESVSSLLIDQANGLFLAKQKIQFLERLTKKQNTLLDFDQNISMYYNDSMNSLVII